MRQDNEKLAPSVPLVGGRDQPSGGAGTAGAGPMQGAATGAAVGRGERMEDFVTVDQPSSGGEDPTGFLGGAETILGGIGDAQGAGEDVGAMGEDGLSGGMGSDVDASGHGGPAGPHGGDEPGARAFDGLETGTAASASGMEPERHGAKVDEANTQLSGTLPDEDVEEDIDRDRPGTAPTG